MNNDFDLANESRSAFATFEEATHYLEDVCARLKVNHMSYWLVHSIDGTPDQVTWITTYDPSYMSFYMENYTPLGDRGFEISIAEDLVMDWAGDDPSGQDLLPTAHKYGITKYGISFPLRDGDFGDVMFSVNVKSNDAEWELLQEDLVAKFRPFAVYFHARAKPLIQSRKFAEINFAA
ncbi:MAG: autoinducer binding domain-containing protein [Aestuariivirga sp.]|nr:autoinducer binding domain-containing protein [Aestuariivirga sp.]